MERLLTKLCGWALKGPKCCHLMKILDVEATWQTVDSLSKSYSSDGNHYSTVLVHDYITQSCAQLSSRQVINKDVIGPVGKPGERLDTLLSTYLYENNCIKPFRWNPVLHMVTPLRRERKTEQVYTKDSLLRTVNLTIWCLTYWEIMSSLFKIMACRLFGTKPLSEPMLEYC